MWDCSKSIAKKAEQYQSRHFSVFIANFEQISLTLPLLLFMGGNALIELIFI